MSFNLSFIILISLFVIEIFGDKPIISCNDKYIGNLNDNLHEFYLKINSDSDIVLIHVNNTQNIALKFRIKDTETMNEISNIILGKHLKVIELQSPKFNLKSNNKIPILLESTSTSTSNIGFTFKSECIKIGIALAESYPNEDKIPNEYINGNSTYKNKTKYGYDTSFWKGIKPNASFAIVLSLSTILCVSLSIFYFCMKIDLHQIKVQRKLRQFH